MCQSDETLIWVVYVGSHLAMWSFGFIEQMWAFC